MGRYNVGKMESWYRDHEVDNTIEIPLFITLFEAGMAHLRKTICELQEYAAIKNHYSNKSDPCAIQRSTFATMMFYHDAKNP